MHTQSKYTGLHASHRLIACSYWGQYKGGKLELTHASLGQDTQHTCKDVSWLHLLQVHRDMSDCPPEAGWPGR